MKTVTFAWQPDVFSEIGLEPPKHFGGLIAALCAWRDGPSREYPEYSFGQTDDLRKELLRLAFDLYVHQRRAQGGGWQFDDPLFRELIGSVTRLDEGALRELSALGEEERDLYPGFSILPLIDTNWRYLPRQEHGRLSLREPWEPCALPIAEGAPAALRGDFILLGVSAFSGHREEANRFLESCVSALPEDFTAALSPERRQALENPRYEEEARNLRSVIEALKTDIAAAKEKGANPSGYEQDLAYFESLMERSEQTLKYLLTEEEVMLAHEKMALVYVPDDLHRAEEDSGIRAGFESFIDGAIPLDLFISQSDNALRLIRAESR